jgi:hypothetical protein
LERSIAIHIFTASSALVGVCLTVISIVRSFPGIQNLSWWVDDMLAVNAMFFLLSCLLSYIALRSKNPQRVRRVERVADAVFLLGLTGIVIACGTIVWVIV